MRVVQLALTAVLVLAARPGRADPCDAAEVARLRHRLELEVQHAHTWRVAWAIGFGAAALAQGTAAMLVDDRAKRATLWVGASKAAIGVAARVVLPVRLEVPAAAPDACADAVVLRDALGKARRAERNGFWLNHVGGLLVNLGGAVVVAHYANWKVGALSFALGYPIGLTSTYTMPRWAWHATPLDHGAAVGVTVAF